MTEYADNSGNSGITEYEISEDNKEITVTFKGGSTYSYPATPKIIGLAESGKGLNTYINKNLK